jgi:hypothetical protein
MAAYRIDDGGYRDWRDLGRRRICCVTQTPVLRWDLPPEIPDDVDDPSVKKASGVVTLPR